MTTRWVGAPDTSVAVYRALSARALALVSAVILAGLLGLVLLTWDRDRAGDPRPADGGAALVGLVRGSGAIQVGFEEDAQARLEKLIKSL